MMLKIKWWDGDTSWLSWTPGTTFPLEALATITTRNIKHAVTYRTHELMPVIELLLQAVENGTNVHGIEVV